MAKKPAPKKAPAKKPAASKKPAPKTSKPLVKKSAKPAPKKPDAKKAPAKAPTPKKPVKAPPVAAKSSPPAPKQQEPAPVYNPVFEAPPKPPSPTLAPAASDSNMTPPATAALTISSQASPGTASNGNTHPANILVLVSCAGWPVTELTKDHFTIMEYFEGPGQQAPFSNNITSFRNVGTGAYLLQVKPINGAPWRSGHHVAQILVSSADDRQGQAAVKLIIR